MSLRNATASQMRHAERLSRYIAATEQRAQMARNHAASRARDSHIWATERMAMSRQLTSIRTTPTQTRHSSTTSSSPVRLARTPLHDLHVSHSAKLVPFGGYEMPVRYADQSVSASHVWTRTRASVFDVSHMVQRMFLGPGAGAFLERITPSDCRGLGLGRSTLSTLMKGDGKGGIVDDTIVTRLEEGQFYVVTNAGCREKDDEYLEEELGKWEGEDVRQVKLDGWGLVALQGPAAEEVLRDVLVESEKESLGELYFGQCMRARLRMDADGTPSSTVLVSRGGYTGEDGFEISIKPDETVDVTRTLLEVGGKERVRLAGLGARDSLRLEAGMCLYGHDLDESTTPVEAGLAWIIPKSRRGADAGYYGAEVIAGQLVPKSKGGAGVERRRVGLVVDGAPAREGAEIVDEKGEKIGNVTSGCPSPTMGKNIAMGYIKDGFHKAGTEVNVVVRGKNRKAVVTKMPFVPSKYHKQLEA